MSASFVIYMKLQEKMEGYKKWPVMLFNLQANNFNQLTSLAEVKDWLKENNKVYYLSALQETSFQTILASQILTIIGPVGIEDRQSLPIHDVYTLKEAAARWGLSDGSTIRKAIERKKFLLHEVRKSESTWLITSDAMTRVYGPEDEESLPRLIVNQIYYDKETGIFQTRRTLQKKTI
jgi:hypothetical protein